MRSVDSETGLMQSALMAPPLACVTWTDNVEDDPGLVHVKDPACKRIVEETLCMPHVGANMAYDHAVFGAQYPDLLPLIFESLDADLSHDVIIMQKLFDIGDGMYRGMEVDEGGDEPVFRSYRYSLSDLNYRYFGEYLEKDAYRLSYGLARHLPLSAWSEGQKKYAKTDATAGLKVFHAMMTQKLRVHPSRYLKPETFQCRAAFALQLIACWGFKTDTREVRRFLQSLAVDQDRRREQLIAEGLVRRNGKRDTKLAKSRMIARMGSNCVLTDTGVEHYRNWWAACAKAKIPITEETKRLEKERLFAAGYVSLSSSTCLMTGDPLLLEYARYSNHQTLISKVSRLKTQGLPIQTGFETLLETGRTSSSASKLIPNSVAIQNLPRKAGMRECFVPRNCEMSIPREQRKILVAADFGMAELVSLAENCYQLFGYSKLRDALNAGIDPHLDLAAMFLGISYEEAKRRKNEELLQEYRQMCKAFNFGKPGGLGPDKFILWAWAQYHVKFGDTPAEALESVKTKTKLYFQKWPEVREYLKHIGKLCDNSTGLCDIQHWKSDHLRGKMQYTVAANSNFQSLTSYGFKAALWEVVKRCYVGKKVGGQLKTAKFERTRLTGNRVVAPVHDEIVLEAREHDADEASLELEDVMVAEYQKWTPNTKIGVERSFSRRWRKGAKPAFRNGRLVPYEDACMEALFGFFARCRLEKMAA
jgi:DNA polymerase family A